MEPFYDTTAVPTPLEYFASIFDLKRHHGNVLVNCCFHSDSSPSLSINVDDARYQCFACGVSGRGVVSFHMTLHGTEYKEALKQLTGGVYELPNRITAKPYTEQSDEEKTLAARKRWEQSQPILRGCPVDLYLRARGIELDIYPDMVRYHPDLPYGHQDGTFTRHPAMVACVQNLTGEFMGIHRTFLTEDGRKADVPRVKKMYGQSGVIQLYKPSDCLGVAEGLETALSYRILADIPVWCAGSAWALGEIQLPKVERVFICVDLDRSGKGELVFENLARRLVSEGRTVYKCAPKAFKPMTDKSFDWNDYLIQTKEINNGN
ncbi:MAG: toprim domain-containing protein [Candidatus Melainabacteria bacterium]|nr:MAG: toprim domain-containing protein [Candidatus Melainabacteria bacterium]